MPRALELIDATVRQLEQVELSPLEAIEGLLAEEFSIRENRRVKTALVMARLSTIKTPAGFDFTFQPSLDRNRVLALAQLDFVDRHQVVHLLGPPGTATSRSRSGSRRVKAGRSVYFVTLADLIGALAKAEREGRDCENRGRAAISANARLGGGSKGSGTRATAPPGAQRSPAAQAALTARAASPPESGYCAARRRPLPPPTSRDPAAGRPRAHRSVPSDSPLATPLALAARPAPRNAGATPSTARYSSRHRDRQSPEEQRSIDRSRAGRSQEPRPRACG